jgi:opacity protein-like surface antigen
MRKLITRTLPLFTIFPFALAFAAPAQQLPEQTLAQRQGYTKVTEAEAHPATQPSVVIQNAVAPSPSAPAPGTSAPPAPAPVHAPKSASESYEFVSTLGSSNYAQPKFSILAGYLHSSWDKITPNLKEGSTYLGISLSREITEGFETGLTLMTVSENLDSNQNENIFAWHLSFDGKYFFVPGAVRPFVGVGLAFGRYRVWPLQSEGSTSITYDKLASGLLVGLIPSAGLRFTLTEHMSFDAGLSYFAYADNPAFRVGGWALGATLSFNR